MTIRIKASNPYAFILLSVYSSLFFVGCFLIFFKEQIPSLIGIPLPVLICAAGLGVVLILFDAYTNKSSIQRYDVDYGDCEH